MRTDSKCCDLPNPHLIEAKVRVAGLSPVVHLPDCGLLELLDSMYEILLALGVSHCTALGLTDGFGDPSSVASEHPFDCGLSGEVLLLRGIIKLGPVACRAASETSGTLTGTVSVEGCVST